MNMSVNFIGECPQTVTRGHSPSKDGRERPNDPRVHLFTRHWIAGSSPAMTQKRDRIERIMLQRSIGTGAASAVGMIELLISTAEPLCSLIWPATTTVSPSFTPLSTAT